MALLSHFSERPFSINLPRIISDFLQYLYLRLLTSGSADTAQKSIFKRVAWLPTSLLLAFIIVPTVAEASVISLLSSLFLHQKEPVFEERAVNSQNIALLQAAVNQDPNPDKGGGNITIVGGTALMSENGPSGTIVDVEDKSSQTGNISIYVVREGDSLGEIAKMFGVSVNTIVWANDIKRGVITPGQTFVILPISGVKHSVVKGDTITSLAKKYKADVEEIIRYNDLIEGSTLALGETVIIPDGEVAVIASAPRSTLRGTGGPSYEGYYIRPILGGRKTQGLHGYNGVDLASEYGAAVFASASGAVIVSRNYGYNGGYGNYIVIQHDNGSQTLYAHLSQNLAYEGMTVYKGQMIGKMGATGKSTGPHLHFEIRGAKNPF